MDVGGKVRLAAERVVENTVEIFHRFFCGVNWDTLFVQGTKSAKIIKAHHMVCMGVGVKNSIDFVNFSSECLQAKFSSGIDDEGTVTGFYEQR
jgi:hypothetical protein